MNARDKGKGPTAIRYRLCYKADAISPSLLTKLLSLGLFPGAEVELVQTFPLGDPYLVRSENGEFVMERVLFDQLAKPLLSEGPVFEN